MRPRLERTGQRLIHHKITSKGQVTIPKDVRERHGFLPGTELRFIDDGEALLRNHYTGRAGPE